MLLFPSVEAVGRDIQYRRIHQGFKIHYTSDSHQVCGESTFFPFLSFFFCLCSPWQTVVEY